MYSRSEASFLQRQNSVRLFGPIRVPTCGMEEDRMRKVFIEDNCKTLIKVSADVVLLQFTHTMILWSYYIRLWLQGRPERFFWHLFWKVFGPARVRISYAFSLRSVFFATSKQRALVWAIKGPTCGMEEDHMRKVFIDDCCKAMTRNRNCLTHS